MDIAELYDLFLENPKISTDTRNILPGSIFFALKGERFNGNLFAGQALSLGAKWAIVDEELPDQQAGILLVDDVLTTLQRLARYHRDRLQIPVIGVTGTNGKTTTKELLFSVLSQKFRTYATKGNLNNHIGVPLSILSITSETEVAIIEMGANHMGEIAALCEIAKPSGGLITNVGRAHLEGFGSFEGVKRAKGELYAWLEKQGGTLFLQGDNEQLLGMANNRNFKEIVTYGYSAHNHIWGRYTSLNPSLEVIWSSFKAYGYEDQSVLTHLTGGYNLENVLAAVAVGLYFGLNAQQVNEGLRTYVPTNNRSQVIDTERNRIIGDYYNANVSSMWAALDNLEALSAEHKAVILGDMFELGQESDEEHRRLVERVQGMPLAHKIFVGKNFYAQKGAARNGLEFYEERGQLEQRLAEHPIEGNLLLLKASRGMAFERLVPYL